MFGAVLATGLSACLAAPVLLAHFALKRCSLLPLRGLHPPRDILCLLSYGVSSLISELASAVSLMTFNLLLMRLSGPAGVAAYGIIANSALVATAIFTGLGQGIQPLASQVFGMNHRTGMRALLGYIRNTVALLSVVLFACAFLFAVPITGAFNHDGNIHLQIMAQDGLRIYFAGYLFAGINITASAFLSAVNRPGRALSVSLLRSCALLIPAAILLSSVLNTTGVWLAFVITEAVCCVFSLMYIRQAAAC